MRAEQRITGAENPWQSSRHRRSHRNWGNEGTIPILTGVYADRVLAEKPSAGPCVF